MMAILRSLVSKEKRRFRENGFDLDLSYITPRTIVMGFPAEGKDGYFRNPLPEVMRFLTTYHDGHFKIINLCAEREYDPCKLGGNVERIPCEDHQPAPLSLILKFCQTADEWLSADERNVLVTHCKAGKGRAGLMICCFLLYTKHCLDPLTALQFYADKRTVNGKGVTIASQRRYVKYFHAFIENGSSPDVDLELSQISVMADFVCIKDIEVVVSSNQGNDTCKLTKVLSTLESSTTRSKSDRTLLLGFDPTWITGDVKIVFFASSTDPLFYFWFNTAYVQGSEFTLSGKEELDKPSKHIKSDIQEERLLLEAQSLGSPQVHDASLVSLFFTGRRPAGNDESSLPDTCQKVVDH